MPKTPRNRLIAQVHVEKKRLRLGEDAYRDLLEAITKKHRSAADCSDAELEQVLIWMRNKFPVKPNPELSPASRNLAKKTTQSKIVALWIECYQQGVVRNRSHSALLAFVERQLGRKVKCLPGVDPLAALNGRSAALVIEALKEMLERKDGGTN